MESNDLQVAAIQSSLHWENPAANRQMFEEKLAACKGAELIVLPEMFSTGFSMNTGFAETMNGATVEFMREQSAKLNAAITGSLMVQEEDTFYNRAVFMLPDGRYGSYDKRHLFAHGTENEFFSAGTKRFIASVKGWRIQLQICYDLRFPAWARQRMDDEQQPEFDVLIYMANWPEPRREAWKTLLRARAIENQCYVMGINRTGQDGHGMNHRGDSAIIDFTGEVLATAEDSEETLQATLSREKLDMFREKLPFLRDADRFDIHQ